MYRYMYISIYLSIYLSLYIYIYISGYVYLYIYIYIYIYTHIQVVLDKRFPLRSAAPPETEPPGPGSKQQVELRQQSSLN